MTGLERTERNPDLPRGRAATVRFGPSPGQRFGFSLPELLVVLLVISVLSVLVIPNIEILKYRMDGAARGVVAALVSAQRQAVVRQHDVIVAFDSTYHRLLIHQDSNNNGVIDSGESTRTVTFDDGVVFGLGGAPPLYSSSSIGFTDTENGLPVARFIRSGSAGEEGHIYLTSERTAESDLYPKDTRAIHVDRATGRVTWYYYDGDQWRKGF